MTTSEMTKMINASIREAKRKLSQVIMDLTDLRDELTNDRDDIECDLPESVEEGRAEKAEEKWIHYQEFCESLESLADDFENNANEVIEM